MSFIKTVHSEAYPAISPRKPELSQHGQTILVPGGGQGVGFLIAKAFAEAGASNIVIASRNSETIAAAVQSIKESVPNYRGNLITKVCDVGDLASSKQLWEFLSKDKVIVDVLVLNVGKAATRGSLIDTDLEDIWDEFNINVRGHLDFTQRFVKQNRAAPNGHKKVILNVSTLAIHDFLATSGMPNYSLTKSASALAVQQIANDIDVNEIQIISFHPGSIFTDAVRRALKVKERSELPIPFDSDDLPGAFSVWAASDEGKFLHGRFVWSAWDVEEMKQGETAKRIRSESHFLKVGVPGLLDGSKVVI